MKPKLLILGFALFFIAAILQIAATHGVPLPAAAGFTVRWLALATLLAYAFLSRSLTPWILVSMVIGAELGADFPHAAAHLKVLGDIFLRMIRVIIAPLLFATLVSGIAGHSDLKQVGRMGIKAMVFFETVTTIALFLGLGAINLTKVGVGMVLPKALGAAANVVATRPTAAQFILHIFPENIAKSVAENQILQVVVFSILFGIALAMVPTEKRKPLVSVSESLA